jgi:hypothetical protein
VGYQRANSETGPMDGFLFLIPTNPCMDLSADIKAYRQLAYLQVGLNPLYQTKGV